MDFQLEKDSFQKSKKISLSLSLSLPLSLIETFNLKFERLTGGYQTIRRLLIGVLI